MQEILILGGIISGVVYGLVELVKYTEIFPKRFLPLVGLIIGLIAGYAAFPFSDLDLFTRLWAGLVAGLGAVGFFENVKQVTKTGE